MSQITIVTPKSPYERKQVKERTGQEAWTYNGTFGRRFMMQGGYLIDVYTYEFDKVDSEAIKDHLASTMAEALRVPVSAARRKLREVENAIAVSTVDIVIVDKDKDAPDEG